MSTSLVIRETQTKTTMRYHLTPTRMVQKNKQFDNTKCGEWLELSLESSLAVPYTVRHIRTISYPGDMPRGENSKSLILYNGPCSSLVDGKNRSHNSHTGDPTPQEKAWMDPHSHVDGSASINCRVGDVGLRRPHRVLSCLGDFLGKVELQRTAER